MDKEKKLFAEWTDKCQSMPECDEKHEMLADLISVKDNEEEIKQRFCMELQFGTAGLRGKMGCGINMINVVNVGRVSYALAKTIKTKKVVIAYDNRRNSLLFAEKAAAVLSSENIKVYLFRTPVPTPLLSFAVREMQCGAGIMITASHNGKEYNGFKCYGSDGCQMTEKNVEKIWEVMKETDGFSLPTAEKAVYCYVDYSVIEKYYQAVLAERLNTDVVAQSDLKVLYTPLNGTGGKYVSTALRKCGLKNLEMVREQMFPDSEFATCPKPNPEETEAFRLALEYAKKSGYDLILATDPDADRMGAMYRDGEEYKLLSGNEIGCLLFEYILFVRKKQKSLPENPVLFKTVVTAPMAEKIAKDYGCNVKNLLVGFKYICEQIQLLQEKNQERNFVFGFEESNGYLCGNYVGDKDGVLAAVLFVEMASWYKTQGKKLSDILENQNKKYGYFSNEIENIIFEGSESRKCMEDFLSALHSKPLLSLGQRKTVVTEDYLSGEITDNLKSEQKNTDLPKNDMVRMCFDDGTSVIIRPSGTEPKLKIYYNSMAKNKMQSVDVIKDMKNDLHDILKKYI